MIFLHFIHNEDGFGYSIAENNISHIAWGDRDKDDPIPTTIYFKEPLFGNHRVYPLIAIIQPINAH